MVQTELGKKQFSPREGFGSTLGVIAATLGSAVGLGNIWKFPYITGENGGAAFIFIYFACVCFIGLPVMISEFVIGRRSNAACVGAFKRLAPDTPWFFTGLSGVICAFFIMFYYTSVAGWVFAYIFKALSGSIVTSDPKVAEQVFTTFISGIWSPLIWQWIVLFVTGTIILAGVKNGIERMTKTLLPILFLLLIVCVVRALTLPGASEGVSFLFQPDFSKITGVTILAAMGLAFFKLSVGMGVMTTYGSYIGKGESLIGTGIKVVLADTMVSMLAGLAIFPAVFSFGFSPKDGPSLLFMTIPMVFNSMPFGQVFLSIFFILASIASMGAMISLYNAPVAYLTEERGWSRGAATIFTGVLMAAIGCTATLSNSLLSDVTLFDMTLFNFYSYLTDNLMMPLTGLVIALFAGWRLSRWEVSDEISNGGSLNNKSAIGFYLFAIRYVAPIAIVIIILNGLGFIKL
ncbi:sodium:neurotransmitter symporter [Desulforamulus reducens MI-1]|uniref:Transporter n=1 Tax=Desulforamulus reducens (strain ATCC BAA-1160 / DSM 100696 / MI-1) TaxID=349161 RepID=A4J843_DESRM|nr:sodium-dependent transporter [Desulforamulus reducens]ABO51246.1 sodium:neurotransmitter symporter [Desulforamulus reducens MI-1]